MAEVLKSHGIQYIFSLPGGHISPILVAAEKLGIRIVDTRHEVRHSGMKIVLLFLKFKLFQLILCNFYRTKSKTGRSTFLINCTP